MKYLSAETSEKLDRVLNHKIQGIFVFLFLLWFMFYCTFNLGKIPQQIIQNGISALSGYVRGILPAGPFKDLLTDGIINGLGSVVVYLPNILILFLFISFLEQSGYIPRASNLMNRYMSRLGLSGQSFLPLIMGFGCNVPAILSAHTIPNRRYRLMTILINPFMSCSARLPVYILIIGAFFPDNPVWVLSFLYMSGIATAVITALIFKHFILPGKKFGNKSVKILSPYNIPSVKTTLEFMWEKTIQYLKKIGGVVLVAVIIIWALNYYPRNDKSTEKYDRTVAAINESNISPDRKAREIGKAESIRKVEQQSQSYLGRFGHFIEPAMRPLGFDRKMSIALISGLPAKEFIVSSLGVLYQVEGEESASALSDRLRNELYTSGHKRGSHVFDKPVALSFLVFVLLYFPCIGTIAAIGKESNRRWAFFSAIYTTGVAWIMSFAVYRISLLIFR